MGQEDRERKFEQALERHLRRDAVGARNEADVHGAVSDEAAGAVECLDAATLAAFHEGMLSSPEMEAAKEHVAVCSRCQEILMQLKATDEIPLQIEAKNDLKPRASVLSTGALYVDYVARQTSHLTIAGQPKPTLKAPQDISRGRGFKAFRWAAPAGAIAAALLVWIVARDSKQHTLSRVENVQVAQQRPTGERPSTLRASPASPPPEPATNIRELNEKRKDDSRAKQPAKESGALRAPKNSSSAAIANEVGAVAGAASPRASVRQLPANSRDYSSLEATENKPAETLSRQADVSVAAAPAAAATTPLASGAPREKSAAPAGNVPTTVATDSANTRTVEPPSNGNGGIELLQTEQGEVTDKLELRSLKKVGFENPKIILASNTTVQWRLLSAGQIEQSVDSGITWTPQNSGVQAELLAGSATSEAVCWIVGRGGTILRTTDGGGHWSKVVSPMRGDVAGVQAVDAITTTIFDAAKKARFVTRDGGMTWEAAKN
jgi:photosynthesis system II assembly factor YCF48-like protein